MSKRKKEPTITHTHNAAWWWDDNPNTADTSPVLIAEMKPRGDAGGYHWITYRRERVNEMASSGIIGHYSRDVYAKFFFAASMVFDTIRMANEVEGVAPLPADYGIALDDRANVDDESENRRLGNIIGAAMQTEAPWVCGGCNYLGLESEDELEKPIAEQKDCEECNGNGWIAYSNPDAA